MKKSFKLEVKRQSRMAITAAIGFIIAYSWKDYIVNITGNWLSTFTTLANTTQTALFSAIFLTLAGAILILISSKILK